MVGNERESCSLELVPLAAHSKNSTNGIHTQIEHLNKIKSEYPTTKQNKLRGLSPQARTIPTERPPLVGEVSVNFSG
jgi:hypothetical protein